MNNRLWHFEDWFGLLGRSVDTIGRFQKNSFTLSLSSGFFGFYAHVGFLKALDELKLNPNSYTGTSAGAIVAAASARGLSTRELEKLVTKISRHDFWDPTPGLGLLRGRKLQDLLMVEIGDSFEDLQKPLRVSVFDIARRSTHVFSSGNLARVIRASCAVPIMFHPVRIHRRLYWDGGIKDKMGIHGLPEDAPILSHYLASSRKDPHSIYEWKRDQETVRIRGKNIWQIQLKGLTRAHPFAMDRGPQIIEEAYRRSMEELTTSVRNTSIR